MNEDFREILEYLQNRNDYAVWAGFAQYAHLGISHSADIDIYTTSDEIKEEISKDVVGKGWQLQATKGISSGWHWNQLLKGETTFDVIFTEASSKLIVPEAVEIEVYGYKIRFISKEWLFLTKLGQSSWPDRNEEKRKRDIEVVNLLRKTIDVEKLKKIAPDLPESYWLRGDI